MKKKVDIKKLKIVLVHKTNLGQRASTASLAIVLLNRIALVNINTQPSAVYVYTPPPQKKIIPKKYGAGWMDSEAVIAIKNVL